MLKKILLNLSSIPISIIPQSEFMFIAFAGLLLKTEILLVPHVIVVDLFS